MQLQNLFWSVIIHFLGKDPDGFPLIFSFISLLKSDLGDLHDHYWSYITIILKGGYWETTEKGTFWRKPGYIGFRRHNGRHSLKIPEGRATWTLLLAGPIRSIKQHSKYSINSWFIRVISNIGTTFIKIDKFPDQL